MTIPFPSRLGQPLALCFLLAAGHPVNAQPEVLNGDELFGRTGVDVLDTSSDGRSFAVRTHAGGGPAQRFSTIDGFQDLGIPAGLRDALSERISGDGTTVGGSAGRLEGPGSRAFRWSAVRGFEVLPSLPGFQDDAFIDAISKDGSALAGTAVAQNPFGARAFHWSAPGGMTPIPPLPGDMDSFASDISADGKVVVGLSRNATTATMRSFRWTAEEGVTPFGPPGHWVGEISANGATAVGELATPEGFETFRWETGRGFETLTRPAGTGYQTWSSLSDASHVHAIQLGETPYLWTVWDGYRPLGERLRDDHGLSLPEDFGIRFSLSGDALTLIGQRGPHDGGGAEEAVVIRIGPDSDGDEVPDAVDNCRTLKNPLQVDTNHDGFGNVCDPDIDGDGAVTLVDWLFLLLMRRSDHPDGDFNGDGRVDGVDQLTLLLFLFGRLPPGPAAAGPVIVTP